MKNPHQVEPVRRGLLHTSTLLESIETAVVIEFPGSSRTAGDEMLVVPVSGGEMWTGLVTAPAKTMGETIDPVESFKRALAEEIKELEIQMKALSSSNKGEDTPSEVDYLNELESKRNRKYERFNQLISGELRIDPDAVNEYRKWRTGPRNYSSQFFSYEETTLTPVPGESFSFIYGIEWATELAIIPAVPFTSLGSSIPLLENYYGVWKDGNSRKVLSTAFHAPLRNYFSFIFDEQEKMASLFHLDHFDCNYYNTLIHSCFSMEIHDGYLFFQILVLSDEGPSVRFARFDGNETTAFDYNKFENGRSYWKHLLVPQSREGNGVADKMEPGFVETTNMKSFGGKLFLILHDEEVNRDSNHLSYFETYRNRGRDEHRFEKVKMHPYKTEPGTELEGVFFCKMEVFREKLYFVYQYPSRPEYRYQLGYCEDPLGAEPDLISVYPPAGYLLSSHHIAVSESLMYLILTNQTGEKYFLYSYDGEQFTDLTPKFKNIIIGSRSRVWTTAKGELLVWAKEKQDESATYRAYSIRDVLPRTSIEFSNGILPPAAPYRPILFMPGSFAPNRISMRRPFIDNCPPGYAFACHEQYEIHEGGSRGFSTRTALKRTSDLALRSAQGPTPAPAPVAGLESTSRDAAPPPETPAEINAQWIATILYTDQLLPEATVELVPKLDKLIGLLKANSGQIILTVYTDNAGSSQSNLEFCDALAAALLAHLAEKGISKGRVVTKSMGGSDTFSNQALNRRLEINLLP
ncbi:MAG: hypothetical protein IPJ82_06940 [Lewinellaceae bacterium]|nr:hypothetical protein [Lewinellaceae bacterium]